MKIKYIIKITQIILTPFGILYGCIMQIRNWLYDLGIFKSQSFSVPIISVGNITVGGTGKTPFTIFLAKQLSTKFKKIAIVSRGYGRNSIGTQLVAVDGQTYLSAEDAGDEPFLLALSIPGSVIIVSEKRADGIRMAIDKFQADLVVLDDAFQHRSVKRNSDILLVNAKESWKWNFPIPAGTLREFKFNSQRAQVIVFTNTDSGTSLPFTPQKKPFFTSSPQLSELVDLENRVVGKTEDFESKKVLAFAGIAHPEYFFSALEEKSIKPLTTIAFRDHYNYKDSDISRLVTQAEKAGAEALLCTEKDLMKIQKLQSTETKLPILAIRLELSFDHSNKLIQKIIGSI